MKKKILSHDPSLSLPPSIHPFTNPTQSDAHPTPAQHHQAQPSIAESQPYLSVSHAIRHTSRLYSPHPQSQSRSYTQPHQPRFISLPYLHMHLSFPSARWFDRGKEKGGEGRGGEKRKEISHATCFAIRDKSGIKSNQIKSRNSRYRTGWAGMGRERG